MVADGELHKAGVTAMIEKRPISPSLLGKAALRIGAREAQNDLGLALASLGLVLAGLRRGPMPVSLPALDDLAALIPPEQRQHAEAILTAARGIVDWLATQEDAALAAAPIAGCA
jgi:hypothetical protein